MADSRDGVAIYRTFKKKEKTKMRLAAVTPFAEALNPMAVSLLRMNSTLWLFMFDTLGTLKAFNCSVAEGELSSRAKDMHLAQVEF